MELYWYGPYDPELFYKSDLARDVMGVYMFLDSEYHEDTNTWTHRLLYIGMVYDQTINERLLQHMHGDDVWQWIQDNYEYEVTFKAAYRTAGQGADKPGARAGGREPPNRSHAAKRQYQKHPHVQVATSENHEHEAVQAAKANPLDQRLGLAPPHTTANGADCSERVERKQRSRS